ncbi:MAG: hypothetical protein ACXU98_04415 [Syntrophales bacterium]
MRLKTEASGENAINKSAGISTKIGSATLYDNKSGESGAELADAFREVVKLVKDGIAGDIQMERSVLDQSSGRFSRC